MVLQRQFGLKTHARRVVVEGLVGMVLWIMATSALSNGSTYDVKNLVPKDARSIENRSVGNGSQVSYVVRRDYPASGIRDEGIQSFRKAGWSYCVKAEDSEWSSFLDATGGTEPRRIYQRLTYLRKGDELITIGQRYYPAPDTRGRSSDQARPGHNEQQVVIVRATLPQDAISGVLSASRVRCETSR
jgi:hypothetical protein